MKQILYFSVLMSSFLATFSQQKNDDVTIASSYTINSEVLEQDRMISVYLPKGYGTIPDQKYPVLYVLDGQEYFLYGIAYQDMLRFRDKSPSLIVVGIATDRRLRRTLFDEKASQFIAFLETELIPFIDDTFVTYKEQERLFFGWEMAAGLGIELMGGSKDLFSAYLLASPTHAYKERMEAIDAKNKMGEAVFALISAAPEERWITQDSLFLAQIKAHPLRRYTTYDREDHYTTPSKTMHEGLSDYFHDYKPVRLRSIAAYEAYGGMEALKAYYKHRGERYGLSKEIQRETQHFLIFSAMQEDNFEQFEYFISEFPDYFNQLPRALWFHRYGHYYAKQDQLERAVELYELGMDKFPESTQILEGLGDVYTDVQQHQKAQVYYKKALAIDPNLSSVQEKMK